MALDVGMDGKDDRIDLGEGVYVLKKDLDGFFPIYKDIDNKPINLLETLTDDIKKRLNLSRNMWILIERTSDIKKDADYRRNMAVLFPMVGRSASKRVSPAGNVTDSHRETVEPDSETMEHEAAIQFDIMDSTQIVDMLEGRTNQKLIYSFSVGGRTIEGISYAGTVDAGRFYSEQMVKDGFKPLEVVDYSLLETDTHFRAFIRVRDGKSGMIIPGYASEPKKMWVYTDKQHTNRILKDDEKADVKAVSKATRNAFRNCMPPSFIDAYIMAVKRGMRK